jgi:hypothetical protein
MRRIIIAANHFATPALADQAPPAPGQRSAELLLERERAQHQQDLGAALQLQDQVATLQKEIADLKAPKTATPAPQQ